MESLEAVAASAAALRATPADIEALAETVAAMDRALAAGRYELWADLNTRFHLAISKLTGMPMLHEMTERVLDRWDRVRRYYFAGVLVHRADQAQLEHHALVEAMKARDILGLEEMVRQHNRGALSSYTKYLEAGAVAAGTA